MRRRGPAPARSLAALVLAGLALAACGETAVSPGGATVLRLGYFANLTHAAPLAGLRQGIFAESLGSRVALRTVTFNAGPDAVEALLSSSVDAAYVGPSPAVNAFVRSRGQAVRIVSGAASGGAALVVRPSILSAAQLKGKVLASPQLGNTQDVALRWWLASQGFRTTPTGGGDVSVRPQDNAQTLQTFRAGQIDGAWVPEPWATRLVLEGGGRVLVDESDLWPGGRFATTELVVRAGFLRAHPSVVAGLVEAQVRTTDFLQRRPEEAQRLTAEALADLGGKRLPDAVVARAWANLSFDDDPLYDSLRLDAEHAQRLGLLPPASLAGICDLSLLNAALARAGEAPVDCR